MAQSGTFTCSVITPERLALECNARFVAFPAHDGEMGILRNRAPLLCKLGIGLMRIEREEGSQVLFIDGGFAQMVENRLTILTEQAATAEEIDAEATRKDLDEARQSKPQDEAGVDSRAKGLARALARLRLSGQVS